MNSKSQKGFTLLEILLVVAAIAILAGIVILAINPNKQLGDTRNAQRKVDINTILNAVYQYSVDNNGTLPADLVRTNTTQREICTSGAGQSTTTCTTALVYLGELVLNERYITAIPMDPVATNRAATGTGYDIMMTAGGRVTVLATHGENSIPLANLTVTR
jgi:prepilin-type N-terminal cleavage/methylation domain-containing protein